MKMWRIPTLIVKVRRNLLSPPLLLPPFKTTQSSGLTLSSLVVTEIGREVRYHTLQRKTIS